MNTSQLILIVAAVALFSGIYFGFDTKPDRQYLIEQSRKIQGEAADPVQLIEKAKSNLQADVQSNLRILEEKIAQSTDAAQQIDLMKQVSGLFYRAEQPIAAAIYADKVADLAKTDSSWSVAGALYYGAAARSTVANEKQFCAARALRSFENAFSLNPANADHQVNMALVYAENPPPDNPMKAVLMLRDLETKFPQAVSVQNALGRLALQTGQWERAVQRLENALRLDPTNGNTICLLAKAYEGLGQADKAKEFAEKCKSI